MSNFKDYSGKELLELKLKKREWLVESLIKERDSVILVGDAKAGKSLLKQQLCCALTSQHPFLDKYKVTRPCRITDIQLEGELEDTQDRFKRMTETLDFDPDKYHLIFEEPLELGTVRGVNNLIRRIDNFHAPEVPDIIFIDPVYFAFKGSLNDDAIVRQFLGGIRIIKNHFGCAVCLVHHTHKMRFNYRTGEIIDEGDEAMFGSKFFAAFPDHVLLFVYDKKNDLRILSCTTQRSGEIASQTMLKLVQPNPLYFKEVDEQPSREDIVMHWLNLVPNGLTVPDLETKTNLSQNTIYLSLKKLLGSDKVCKTKTRPVLYTKKHSQN